MVIRGAAGSGKTTVALHRIAYLAYEDPTIDSDRTLFVVFFPALREYVSHVLPALGVHHVQIRDFREWVSDLRRRHFPSSPVVPRRHARGGRPVQAPSGDGPPPRGPGRPPRRPADPRAGARRLRERHHQSGAGDADLGEADPDAFSETELARITTWCRDRMDQLAAKSEGDTDTDAALDAEDDALLLYAWQLRVGPLRRRREDRSSVCATSRCDEVQDFSPLEVRVLLGCLDEHRSITLAGDTQQHVMKDAGFTSWAEFFSHLGLEGASVDTLRIAYRSSGRIVELSRQILGELAEDDEAPLVTRTGPPVELFTFTDAGAASRSWPTRSRISSGTSRSPRWRC